jgi:hypothetical protein
MRNSTDPVPDFGGEDAFLARRDPLVRLVEHAATNLSKPPRYRATGYVECTGESLSKVLWLGHQWAVTTFGVEARDGCYVIAASRLWENEAEHGWVRHMASKAWVDAQDFSEALRIGRARHAPRNPNAG